MTTRVTVSSSSRSATAISPYAPNPFLFPTGDIRILVTYKNKSIAGIASSHSLQQASPIWDKFIYPPWVPTPPFISSSSAARTLKEIDFSDDDGDALLILLNIIHLLFKLVPKSLTFQTYYQVALLCDQYLCVGIIEPWLVGWTESLYASSMESVAVDKLLFAHWVFGQEELFRKAAKRLVLEAKTNQAGECLDKDGSVLDDLLLDGMADNVLRIRKFTIEALLAIPYAMLNRYKTKSANLCLFPDHNDNHCDAAILGSLVRGLYEGGLEPPKIVDDIYLSVDEVAAALDEIHIWRNDSHHDCSAKNFQPEVADVLANVEIPVSGAHRYHMKMQRRELG